MAAPRPAATPRSGGMASLSTVSPTSTPVAVQDTPTPAPATPRPTPKATRTPKPTPSPTAKPRHTERPDSTPQSNPVDDGSDQNQTDRHSDPDPTYHQSSSGFHASTSSSDPWERLAACESGGNPRATNPSGKYRGLFQFDFGTWQANGGSGDPINASVSEQLRVAKNLYNARGWAPWPQCRYIVHLG